MEWLTKEQVYERDNSYENLGELPEGTLTGILTNPPADPDDERRYLWAEVAPTDGGNWEWRILFGPMESWEAYGEEATEELAKQAAEKALQGMWEQGPNLHQPS